MHDTTLAECRAECWAGSYWSNRGKNTLYISIHYPCTSKRGLTILIMYYKVTYVQSVLIPLRFVECEELSYGK